MTKEREKGADTAVRDVNKGDGVTFDCGNDKEKKKNHRDVGVSVRGQSHRGG